MDHYADFANGPISVFRPEQLRELRERAELNQQRPRYRFCAHEGTNDSLQEMYICTKDEGYIPVYQHPDTATTHFILDGSIALVIFDELGEIVRTIVLEKEKGAWSCRVGAGIYYMTFVVTTWATYFECKSGPFTSSSNLLAPWTPDVNESEKVNRLMEKVSTAVEMECQALGLGTLEELRNGKSYAK